MCNELPTRTEHFEPTGWQERGRSVLTNETIRDKRGKLSKTLIALFTGLVISSLLAAWCIRACASDGLFPVRKGYWHLAKTYATNSGLSKQYLEDQGLVSLRTLWIGIHYPA